MNFKISCLLFAKDLQSRLLLLKRKKSPNQGLWSPPGGKLEMSTGESPVECAIREAYEELGICLKDDDLNLFGYVSEKNYEGNGHWLMFLFDILPAINEIPKEINEGHFRFFNRSAIDKLEIPSTDFELVWPFYDKRKEGFWGVRANFGSKSTKIKVEARPV